MSPRAQLADLAEAVAAARRAVAEGAAIELSGLDAAVAQVCDAAHAVPDAERAAFARDLVVLADALEQLAADIARRSEAQTAAARRRRAANARGDGG